MLPWNTHDLANTVAASAPVFFNAMALSFGLIVAIGAQNAFVLRQGLRREHVGAIVLFCAASDALLIAAGVLGLGQALAQHVVWARALAAVGSVFLLVYGLRALQRAWWLPASGLVPAQSGPAAGLSRRGALAQAAAFTLLNPHVYLDTVLLVGSVGAQQPPALQGVFIAGAACASLLWFVLLGLGARRLAPWLAQPRAWQWLDSAIGLTMLVLAAYLARQAMG